MLALATARALELAQSVLPLAAALELIHTYSLIHDDLPAMDDDDLRRGRPTCHKRFGEDVAILAGDGLYAEAFRYVLQRAGRAIRARCSPRSPSWRPRPASTAWSAGSTSTSRTSPSTGESTLRRLHELKTGRLIGASVECVLLLAGRCRTALDFRSFREFAAELGVLFQIVDDILDVTGTDAALGKPQRIRRAPRQADLRELLRPRRGAQRWPRSRTRRPEQHCERRRARPDAAELEQITDFIYTRPS